MRLARGAIGSGALLALAGTWLTDLPGWLTFAGFVLVGLITALGILIPQESTDRREFLCQVLHYRHARWAAHRNESPTASPPSASVQLLNLPTDCFLHREKV